MDVALGVKLADSFDHAFHGEEDKADVIVGVAFAADEEASGDFFEGPRVVFHDDESVALLIVDVFSG